MGVWEWVCGLGLVGVGLSIEKWRFEYARFLDFARNDKEKGLVWVGFGGLKR